MANGVLGAWDLLPGVPQAIYVCNNDQATVLTLNFVNRSNVPANVRVSIGTGGSVQNAAEFLEFDTEVNAKGVLERTGLIVSPGMYLVVKSDAPKSNASCWGVEVGTQLTSANITQNTGTAPTWVTAAGLLGTVTVGQTTDPDVIQLQATHPNSDSNKLKYTVTGGSLPAGTVLDINGEIKHVKTSTGYTSGATGQTANFDVTASNGTNGSVRSFSIIKKWNDGSSSSYPAPSGYWLAQNIGSAYLPSGNYWIKSSKMPSPLLMYVDMVTEGGGYDYYRINGGVSVSKYNEAHSGTNLGLDLIYPRSKYHWYSLRQYLNNVVGSTDYTYLQNVPGIYRSKNTENGSNTYVARAMRSIHHASYAAGVLVPNSYAPDWRVPDGGRWWLRDTPFTEPNGDYTLDGFLGDLAGRNGLPSTYSYQDIMFNDGATYATGSNYIVSTNAKP